MIRSIKPEFWRSRDITALSWDARLVFIGLWSYVDDNGVGRFDLASIAGDLFVQDLCDNPRDTLARLSRALQQIISNGLAVVYEIESKDFIFITGWNKHQRIDRPNKARLPLPDGEKRRPTSDDDFSSCNTRDTLATLSRHYRETPATGTGEQGNRGTGELINAQPPKASGSNSGSTGPAQTANAVLRDTPTPKNSYPEDFETFWAQYPLKRGKRKALKAFKAAKKRASAKEITQGAARYAADPNRVDQFTKYAEGWLNGNGWEDDPLPARAPVSAAERRTQTQQQIWDWATSPEPLPAMRQGGQLTYEQAMAQVEASERKQVTDG